MLSTKNGLALFLGLRNTEDEKSGNYLSVTFCPRSVGQIFEGYNFLQPEVGQIQVSFHFSMRM